MGELALQEFYLGFKTDDVLALGELRAGKQENRGDIEASGH